MAADFRIENTAAHEGETVTMVSVRVGVFGDENFTRAIFDKIEDRLKLM